jgi:hypothetical protein
MVAPTDGLISDLGRNFTKLAVIARTASGDQEAGIRPYKILI